MNRKLITAKFILYSWAEAVGHPGLTEEEQSFCTDEEYAQLIAFNWRIVREAEPAWLDGRFSEEALGAVSDYLERYP